MNCDVLYMGCVGAVSLSWLFALPETEGRSDCLEKPLIGQIYFLETHKSNKKFREHPAGGFLVSLDKADSKAAHVQEIDSSCVLLGQNVPVRMTWKITSALQLSSSTL